MYTELAGALLLIQPERPREGKQGRGKRLEVQHYARNVFPSANEVRHAGLTCQEEYSRAGPWGSCFKPRYTLPSQQ